MKEYVMQETEEVTAFGSVWRKFEPAKELIRCVDCEWFSPTNAEEGDLSGTCTNDSSPCWDRFVNTTFYCAEGEKRDDD